MTKRLFEIECMGHPVTVEITDQGPVFHGYDPDAEESHGEPAAGRNDC